MSPLDLACLDGQVQPLAEAVVSVTDEGLIRGDGVFEVVRLYRGVPFALQEHLDRLRQSARNLRLSVDVDALEADVAALLAAAQPQDCLMRWMCTRGGRRILLLEALKEGPAALRLATVTCSPTRILDGTKSLSYGANVLATRLAAERGADEALLVTPHGRVLEGPTSSLFYVLDGELWTPPLDDHILDSITRRHVIALTGARERITPTDDLPRLEEAFLASTVLEVRPVSAIGAHALAAPGPQTAAAAEAFAGRVQGLRTA